MRFSSTSKEEREWWPHYRQLYGFWNLNLGRTLNLDTQIEPFKEEVADNDDNDYALDDLVDLINNAISKDVAQEIADDWKAFHKR